MEPIMSKAPTIAVNDEFTGDHNHYLPDEYIQRDVDAGSIRLGGDRRAAQVSESFVTGLHAGVEAEVGESAGFLMYRSGFEWGTRNIARFNERMRRSYGGGKRDIWQMNPKFVFENWWWPMTLSGFGGWSLDLKFDRKNIVVVEIRNSAVAQSMERAGKPVCHMYAGLFAGAFSYFDRRERSSIELQCYAMGSDHCKFLVGDATDVNAADFWVKEGASASEVVERLD
jgi:predicted hydrocarbon binding protein